MNYMRITYYHTMYQREVTALVTDVRFDNGKAYFKHMGCGEAVEVEYIRSIEAMQD